MLTSRTPSLARRRGTDRLYLLLVEAPDHVQTSHVGQQGEGRRDERRAPAERERAADHRAAREERETNPPDSLGVKNPVHREPDAHADHKTFAQDGRDAHAEPAVAGPSLE